jgi:hypothetical protein
MKHTFVRKTALIALLVTVLALAGNSYSMADKKSGMTVRQIVQAINRSNTKTQCAWHLATTSMDFQNVTQIYLDLLDDSIAEGLIPNSRIPFWARSRNQRRPCLHLLRVLMRLQHKELPRFSKS